MRRAIKLVYPKWKEKIENTPPPVIQGGCVAGGGVFVSRAHNLIAPSPSVKSSTIKILHLLLYIPYALSFLPASLVSRRREADDDSLEGVSGLPPFEGEEEEAL